MTGSPRSLLSHVGSALIPFLTVVIPLTTTSIAADWPQWRGPERNGKSPDTGLLQEWPDGGPPLAWRAGGLGAGFSSLSMAGDRIYTMGDLADGQYVIALHRNGGGLLWKTRVGPVHEDKYPGPRATPTIDGDRIYAMSTEGDVVCLDGKTGAEVWRRSLTRDYGGYLMKAMGSYQWKFSESPLVDGDRVIVTPGHVEAMMVALDKKSGKEIWKTQGTRLGPLGADGAAYSSAVISEAAGTRQYVQLVGRGLIGVDAESGKLLWGYNRVANDIANIATPLVRDDYVFASSGYGTGSGLVKIVRGEEGFEAREVYFLDANTMQNHHGGLILHDGTVFAGTGHNKGFPIAVDFMTGKVAWGPAENEGRNSAAITYADGRIYFRYQDGRMILVEATAKEYRERGSFVIPDVEKESWSHPVIVDGKLYLREQDRLYCYDVKAPQKAAARRATK
ncbi:MAG TPA: PQQ-binding-like beta-propeller repeat protein [Candidatus Polarisedimenticolia bacterium]|nr:PQQ-binding-like beta-propeller repeat protein [Candidatus Polarisedimenticolia bacterium]